MKSFLKYWLPVLIWVTLIFIGSTDLLSAEHTSRIIGPILRWLNPNISVEAIAQVQLVVRKAGHLTEYAILAALVWRGLRRGAGMESKSGSFALAWLICIFLAAFDEFHQSFVPSRTSSSIDVAIDGLGAFLALTICVAVTSRKVLKEERA